MVFVEAHRPRPVPVGRGESHGVLVLVWPQLAVAIQVPNLHILLGRRPAVIVVGQDGETGTLLENAASVGAAARGQALADRLFRGLVAPQGTDRGQGQEGPQKDV